MSPRAKQFAQAQARANVRDQALVTYIKLRKLGWETRQAWILAQGGEIRG